MKPCGKGESPLTTRPATLKATWVGRGEGKNGEGWQAWGEKMGHGPLSLKGDVCNAKQEVGGEFTTPHKNNRKV